MLYLGLTISEISISLEEFDGDKDVPEQTLSALVARTTEPGPLVELGVGVNINHESRAIGTRRGGRGRGFA